MNDETTTPIPADASQNTPPPEQMPHDKSDNRSVFTKYKYPIVAVAIGIVLLLIGGMQYLSPSQDKSTATVPSPTLSQESPTAMVPPTEAAPSTTDSGKVLTPQEAAAIDTQIKPALTELIQIDYTILKAKSYGETWAILQVGNPTTDPASVLVAKENGKWTIKLGPGTSFDETEMKAVGAPAGLISDIYSGF